MYKGLWKIHKDINALDKAIHFYNRGFTVKRDYYNGINLAYLYNIRSTVNSNDERIADNVIANRVRKDVVDICLRLIEKGIEDTVEKYWVCASLEEAYFALGDYENSTKYKEMGLSQEPDSWMRDSTEKQLAQLKALLDSEEK